MKYQIFLISALVLLMSSCAAIKVMSDYNKQVNFAEYNTFQLLERKSSFPFGANPINQERLEKGIKEKMTSLNFKESENPDLYITYFVKKVLRENAKVYGEVYDEWDYPNQNEIFQYQEGTLVVDLLDVKRGKVVWHGALTRPTTENINTAEKRINQNMEAMFNKLAKEIVR